MKKVSTGVNHRVSKDLRKKIESNEDLLNKWNTLTPLARNEWICYITIVKNEDTRKEHLKRLGQDLCKGKKRPCCWPGCPHRRANARKWFNKKN